MGAETPCCMVGVRALMADSRFQDMLTRLASRGMGRAEFDGLPMPDGCSSDEMWGLVRSIRRAQGIHYRDVWSIGGVASTQWFYPTHSIECKLRELSRRTGSGSLLDQALSERFGRRFVTGPLIGETVAAVSCEGLSITYEEARRVCLGDAVPRWPVERLVANMHALLVRMLGVVCHFWRNSVFPLCNYVLGSLVCRLYLKQRGYPAFAYLPISQMSLAWRQGLCDCAGVWPYGDCCDVEGTDYDWTLYWESCLQLLLNEVQSLEETILRVKDEDDGILVALRTDHSFNHRQRALLERAVLTPATAVRIEEYRAQHGLAYSTASNSTVCCRLSSQTPAPPTNRPTRRRYLPLRAGRSVYPTHPLRCTISKTTSAMRWWCLPSNGLRAIPRSASVRRLGRRGFLTCRPGPHLPKARGPFPQRPARAGRGPAGAGIGARMMSP